MQQIIIDVGQFAPYCGGNVKPSEMLIERLLDCMVWMNSVLLRCQDARIPWLYEAGRQGLVKYQREPPGIELFYGIEAVLREKGGDCDDLSCWRVAELNVRGDQWDAANGFRPQSYYPNGEPAEIMLKKFERPGALLYHVLVKRAPTPQHPNGFIEDPSKALGMKGSG